MPLRPPGPALALALVLGCASGHAAAAGALGPAGLRAEHATLEPQLAARPLVLKSAEAEHRMEGEVHAVLERPFAMVSSALAAPQSWCDILILHLNNKQCLVGQEGAAPVLDVRVGNSYKQPVEQAAALRFTWQPPQQRPDYLAVRMVAADGPYDTHDYQLVAEAMPLAGNRTLLHMAYSLAYGAKGGVALSLYFGTSGRNKVGFSPGDPASGSPHVAGARGLVERNTMRYFLALDAYLQSLAAPPAEQLQKRMEAWFDATEKYPRQLHEMERGEYLQMKRGEVARQGAGR